MIPLAGQFLRNATDALRGIVFIQNSSLAKSRNTSGIYVVTGATAELIHTVAKAFGVISGAGVVSANSFGIASASVSGADITVTLSRAMANTNYAVNVNFDGVSTCTQSFSIHSKTTTSFIVRGAVYCSSGPTVLTAAPFNLSVFGDLA